MVTKEFFIEGLSIFLLMVFVSMLTYIYILLVDDIITSNSKLNNFLTKNWRKLVIFFERFGKK